MDVLVYRSLTFLVVYPWTVCEKMGVMVLLSNSNTGLYRMSSTYLIGYTVDGEAHNHKYGLPLLILYLPQYQRKLQCLFCWSVGLNVKCAICRFFWLCGM